MSRTLLRQALAALEELASLHQASLIVKGRKVRPDEILGSLSGKVFVIGGTKQEQARITQAEARAKEMAVKKAEVQKLKYKAPKTAKRDKFSPYSFGRIEVLPQFGDKEKAHAMLKELAEDPGISRVMKKHQFTVGALKEMYPDGKVGVDPVCVMGLNKNKGEEILLRLRTDDLRGFQRLSDVKKVLYHELAHNEFSDHDSDFKALMSRLIKEGNSLDWTQRGTRVGTERFDTMGIGTALFESEDGPAFEGGTGALGSVPDGDYYERLASRGKKKAKSSPREDTPGPLEEFINEGAVEPKSVMEAESNAEEAGETGVLEEKEEHKEEEQEEEEGGAMEVDPVPSETAAPAQETEPPIPPPSPEPSLLPTLVEMGFEQEAVERVLAQLPSGSTLELAALRLCEEEANKTPPAPAEHELSSSSAPAEAAVDMDGGMGTGNEELDALGAMGFELDVARRSLEQSGGQLQDAISLLLSGKVDLATPEANLTPQNPAATAAASGVSVLDDRQTRLEGALQRLGENALIDGGGVEAAQEAFTTVIKLLSNALEHPSEDKYRSIRLSNKAFYNRVGRHDGGIEALRAVGWEERGTGADRAMAFVRGDPGLLWLGKATAERSLQHLVG